MAEEIKAEPLAAEPETVQTPEEETKISDEQVLLEKDYEVELARERGRRESAEKAAADVAFKLREQKRKERESENDETVESDKPLTATELESILQKDRQQARKEFQSELIIEKIKKLSSSDAEARLIAEVHHNRTFPEGLSLDEQLEEAYVIANRRKILATNEELKRALKSKDTASGNPAGTYRDSAELGEPKISQNDLRAIKGAGFQWDGKQNAWRMETKGRTIFKSRDLKKTWTLGK